MKDVFLTADVIGGRGVLSEAIAEGVKAIRQRVIANDADSGDGSVTIKIKVKIDAGGAIAKISMPEPVVSMPPRRVTGQIVRFDEEENPIVNVDEDENNQMRFPGLSLAKMEK